MWLFRARPLLLWTDPEGADRPFERTGINPAEVGEIGRQLARCDVRRPADGERPVAAALREDRVVPGVETVGEAHALDLGARPHDLVGRPLGHGERREAPSTSTSGNSSASAQVAFGGSESPRPARGRVRSDGDQTLADVRRGWRVVPAEVAGEQNRARLPRLPRHLVEARHPLSLERQAVAVLVHLPGFQCERVAEPLRQPPNEQRPGATIRNTADRSSSAWGFGAAARRSL